MDHFLPVVDNCRCTGFQIQLSGELTRVMRRIRRTVVCQPLHRFIREPGAEALLNRTHHHVLNCHSLRHSLPSLWLLCRSSPTRTSPAVFRRRHNRTRSSLSTSAGCSPVPRFYRYVRVKGAVLCHAVTTDYVHSSHDKSVQHSPGEDLHRQAVFAALPKSYDNYNWAYHR